MCYWKNSCLISKIKQTFLQKYSTTLWAKFLSLFFTIHIETLRERLSGGISLASGLFDKCWGWKGNGQRDVTKVRGGFVDSRTQTTLREKHILQYKHQPFKDNRDVRGRQGNAMVKRNCGVQRFSNSEKKNYCKISAYFLCSFIEFY